MKLIIKNDSKETVKNPNIKIIETTEASFINQTVFIEENDVPIIKYTDTESMYFVKDLDNLYDRKSRSEVLLDITIDNLELIGGGSSEPVDPRPYKVYTALLTQSGTNAPVATVLENTLGGDVVWSYYTEGVYNGELLGAFIINKTDISFGACKSSGQAGDKINIYDDEGESEDSIKIIQQTYDNNFVDGFSNIRIEIRVYN